MAALRLQISHRTVTERVLVRILTTFTYTQNAILAWTMLVITTYTFQHIVRILLQFTYGTNLLDGEKGKLEECTCVIFR